MAAAVSGTLPPHAAKKRRVGSGAVSGAITEQEELELAMAISASMAASMAEPPRAEEARDEEGESAVLSEARDEQGDLIDEADESGEDTPLIARMQRAKAKAAFGTPDPSAAPAAAPEMVGQLIEIYWPLDEQWYAASVTKWVERSGKHRVLYIEDGVSEFRRQSQALRRASLTTSMVITPTYWKPPLAAENGPSLTGGSVASRGERSRQRSLHVGLSGLLDLNELKARKKKLIFGKSAIHSWGLYAAEAIEKEDFVVEYLGEYVRKAVSEVREKHYRRWGWGDDYIFRVDDDLFVDATRRGGLARFANHCCEPNCYTRIIKAGGKQRIVLYSKERIEQGEEITYNYQFDYEDDRSNAIPCCCGARKCTGWLN
ncbi:histone-lysine n-methyltransferase setd1 [Chrysochromulina tobinii]|uniref:[histone H3]-lysine(4) N-trimethyltransferase n=1 Tax=Chrysochromulina tobinii TaxID=1460289 RepID=A0A0M0JL06_9EUKA|nr:histone-lysine n-methyltransferase setd1 [Chrysochromulina tobinii]|eukprot:KOO27264.1 histone-lysine n-methyltransferase setd1 [Chrysochromulina sp. CCMP291]